MTATTAGATTTGGTACPGLVRVQPHPAQNNDPGAASLPQFVQKAYVLTWHRRRTMADPLSSPNGGNTCRHWLATMSRSPDVLGNRDVRAVVAGRKC